MTDEREQPNPWDPPADGPPAEQTPAAQPGSWQSDQTGYGQQTPAPPPYGQPQSPYGQPQAYGQQPAYPPPTPPTYGQQPPQYGYPAPAGSYGAQPYYGPKTSGKATTVMVLGILSVVLMFMCGLGFILAIVALVMVPGARREIAESGGQLTGDGQVKAGKILSWITLGLTAVGIVAVVAIIIVAVAADTSSDDSPASPVRTNATALAYVAG
jgi:hypothetical protein